MDKAWHLINIEKVNEFTSLGAQLTKDGDSIAENRRRVQFAYTFYTVLTILKDSCITMETKLLSL